MYKDLILNRKKRNFLAIILLIPVLIIILISSLIPFYYESSSILYKFGIEKILLNSGKVLGIITFCILSIQLFLVSKFKFADQIFSLIRLYKFHQINAVLIGVLILIHPLSILASEKFTFFPLELRYWPEFLGIVTSAFILLMIFFGFYKNRLKISYENWLFIHRISGLLIVVSAFTHIIFVSESFESGVPRFWAIIICTLNLFMILKISAKRIFIPGLKYQVSEIENLTANTTLIRLKNKSRTKLNFQPGQFAFITPFNKEIPKETHPFTISSSPEKESEIFFIIRKLGDFTSKIKNLKKDDKVILDGPYGHFSFKFYESDNPLILIAGGIGITPMLSMLSYIADKNIEKEILLIWSNRTKDEVIMPEFINELEKKINRLKLVNIYTGINDEKEKRLNKNKLKGLLKNYDLNSDFFICGPPAMMKDIKKNLIKIDFKSASIYTEEFSLNL